MSSDVAVDRARPSSAEGTVQLRGVTKVYDLETTGVRLRDAFPGRRPPPRQPLVAVDHVDLDVARGESVGLIGANGAGKSTVLKLVAGITGPTDGSVAVAGRVGSMVELGLGFHPELTGWENLACTGVVLGLEPEEVQERTAEMAAFSGIEDALGHQLKTYSTGMRARLGFAIATHVGADVLVIDEVLAVGDAEFQRRCLARIATLAASGTTIVLVSHDMSLIAAVCARAVHLREGRVVDDGETDGVIGRYLTRTPSAYLDASDRAMRFEHFGLAADQIDPWSAIEIQADVRVTRALAEAEVGVDFEKVVSDERDRTIASAVATLPALTEPGRFRLRGTTSPWPAAFGSVSVVGVLVDAHDRQVTDRASARFRVAGRLLPGNIQPDLHPQIAIEAATPRRPGPAATSGSSTGAAGELVVRARGLTKRFAAPGRGSRAKLAVPGRAGWGQADVAALDGLDLDIHAGTSLGVIGTNGAGKSTLLRMVAGITSPDAGTIETRGRVVPVLDLGLGFHPDLTAQLNVRTSGRLLGMTEEEVDDVYEAIVAFAGLEDVMHVPVKRFSTGMRSRLGFALAMHAAADVLLLDELLAVGDETFRRVALDTVQTRVDDGVTVIFVSHELRLVEQLCNRAVRLEAGRVVDDGPAGEVVGRYGGSSWAGGARDASSGIRLHEVTLKRHHVPDGGTFEFGGLLEVAVPSNHARLEVAYRVPPANRSLALDPAEVAARTFLVAPLPEAAPCFSEPGWYRFDGVIERNVVCGAFDLVVSVVDEREHVVISESWQPATVGRGTARNKPGIELDIVWDVERLPDEGDGGS
jgi:ABC-type polysaccharide/polyol phosphate transport system ATPase subunit